MSSPYREPHNSKMSYLWGVQAALIASRKPLPPRRKATLSASEKPSAQDAVYKCDCGYPEASEKWICCDGDDCPVKWYHWKCVQVTDAPTGDWFCPKCSHKSQSQEKRQLLDQPQKGKTPVLPNLSKTVAERSTGTSTVTQKKKGGNTVMDKGHVRVKKGTAIKKPTPKKTRRIEWVETSSEDEDEEERTERNSKIQDTVTAERTARKKARATQSTKRLTQSHRRQGSLKRASKQTKNAEIQPKEKIELSPSPPNHPRPNPGRQRSTTIAAHPTTPIATPQPLPSQHAIGVTSGYSASEEDNVA